MTENADRSLPNPEQAQEQLEQALFEIRRIIAGQDAMLERSSSACCRRVTS